MTLLKPVRSLTDEEVSLGDVIRWGTDARWAIVCEVDHDTAQGSLARLRWAFGKDRGSWVSDPTADMIEGWELLRTNCHAMHMLYGKHVAKDRRDAQKDATAVLGYKADGWYSS